MNTDKMMKPTEKIDRSASGLRDALFATLEQLRDGKIDAKNAVAHATVAQAILKSVEIQVSFEKLRLESKVPSNLPDMKLVPPLNYPALSNQDGKAR